MAEKRQVLVHNANVHTVDEIQPHVTWFTVLGDRIQRAGLGPPPQNIPLRLDLGGRTVVPGFVDAHAHFFQTGIDKLFIDLLDTHTVAELGRRLTAGSVGGKRTWLIGHSFEEDELTDVKRLTRAHLDELFPDRPVWVNRIDYHAAVVNSVALRRLDVPLGTHGLLQDRGQPNGILRSEAYFHAKARVAQAYPIEIKERAVKTAADACIARGITAVHALEGGRIFGDAGVPMLLKRLHLLPLHVTLFLQEKNVYFTTRLGFEHLGGCILLDGSIGSYTAALNADYEGHPGQRGVLYEKQREFTSFVEEAHEAGVQLAFHAIGPRAIDMVLSAYDRALTRFPRYDHRHRIEHFELATDEQIARARDLGLVISMQPSFEQYWGGPDGMYASRLGERWRSTNRLRTILDRGILIAGGSDTNVTPPDPLLGIHGAVNHPNEEQRVSVEQALRMFTIDAAYSGFNENRHGSISPGKQADFVVLGADPFQVPAATLREIQVLQTWYRGRAVYRNPDGADLPIRGREGRREDPNGATEPAQTV